MNDIDTHLRTRLRAIIWKQWKVLKIIAEYGADAAPELYRYVKEMKQAVAEA